MTKNTLAKRIPKFANHQEEAAFWDTHDAADYWDEFRPIKIRFAKNLSAGLSIRLDAATLGELREQAAMKGIGPTTLARMWILEHLQAAPPRKLPRSSGSAEKSRRTRARAT